MVGGPTAPPGRVIQQRRDPWAPETDDEQRPGIRGLSGSERVSAGRSVPPRDPGHPWRLVPSRRPFRPRPCAAGLCSPPPPRWACPVNSVFSVAVSSAPYSDSPSSPPEGLPFPFRLPPCQVPRSAPLTLTVAPAPSSSSCYLFSPVRRLTPTRRGFLL